MKAAIANEPNEDMMRSCGRLSLKPYNHFAFEGIRNDRSVKQLYDDAVIRDAKIMEERAWD